MDYGVKSKGVGLQASGHRTFPWFLLICCLFTSTVTACLGFWQVSRAHEKSTLAHSIAALAKATAWTHDDFRVDESRWKVVHHPVVFQGRWRSELTFFLGNRTHQGGIGFWVFTPLVLEDGSWVLVKRGWSPRHPVDPGRTPRISSEAGTLTLKGRLDTPPSQWMTLGKTVSMGSSPWPESKILDNVDMQTLSKQWAQDIKAVVLQTDPSSEELRRDWPATDLKVDTHWGYAVQWFALSLTSLLLFIWYQWFKPRREAINEGT
jgi:surfeit locus 1 family protein